MLQRLAQFRVALLEFLEQTHVLDRNDRLRGKGFSAAQFAFPERTNFRATNMNAPMATPHEAMAWQESFVPYLANRSCFRKSLEDWDKIMNVNGLRSI